MSDTPSREGAGSPFPATCRDCGRQFASLIDRDVHSFQRHGSSPGSTVAPSKAGAEKPPDGYATWLDYAVAHTMKPPGGRVSFDRLDAILSAELAALRAAREEMREALAGVVAHLDGQDDSHGVGDLEGMADYEEITVALNARTIRAARAALGKGEA